MKFLTAGLSSLQSRSRVQLFVTPMNFGGTPGLPVHYQPPESTQDEDKTKYPYTVRLTKEKSES